MRAFCVGILTVALMLMPGLSPRCQASSLDSVSKDFLSCSYGLTFRSHKYSIDERTALNLTPDRPLNLRRGFRIDFDLCLNHEDAAYGYVMRLISGDSSTLDINANINTGNLNFVLIRDGNTVANVPLHDEIGLEAGRWMHVSVEADAGEIVCRADSVSHRFRNELADLSDIELWFGACGDERFYSTDVAPMTLKDITVSSPKGRLREWRLCRNNGTEVYDELHGAKATVAGGIWEIDRHTGWTRLWSETFGSQPEIAFDRGSSRLFVASAETVVDRSLSDGTERRTEVKSGNPFVCGGSQMIYDPEQGRLISYSLQFPEFTTFDFTTGRWSSSRRENIPRNQQHSRWFEPSSRMLYVFGGYGSHLYNSDFYTRDIDGRQWDYRDLSGIIAPRYLAAMGVSEGNLIVMGGYGNRSGRQEESPRNMYDISRIEPQTGAVTYVSGFSLPDDRYSMASTLVCDSGKIYSLAFDNGRSASSLNLFSVSPDTPEAVFYGNPIPYAFHDIESYSELAFSPDSTSLYAIVSNAASPALGGGYQVEVYEMAYPPMAAELVRQPVRKTSGLLVALLTLAAVALVAAAVVAAVLVRRKRHAGKADAPEPEAVPVPDRSGAAKTPSSISLLGGLSIIDSEGNDVTTEFSPISRQLLLLILMNSKVKPVGITSEVLDDTLWYGMERKQAANNRNVNIRKLRLRLEKVWDVELTGRNGYWFFALEDLSRCDYLEVGQLMKDVLAKPDDRARLNRLLTLVMNGPLLPDNDFEWLDDYKSRYTNMIIENLVKIQRFWEDDDDMSIMIARAMRVQDIIDEEAIRIYCRALYRKGSRSQSRSAWDKFTEDYRRIMGTLPDFSWSQIIEG